MPLSPVRRHQAAWCTAVVLLVMALLGGCKPTANRGLANDPAAQLRAKYYDYFAQHNSTINPLFTFSDPATITDDNLMTFAILNSAAVRQPDGTINTADIDATLNRYFGRTVKRYATGVSTYDSTKKLITPIGFSFDSSVHMMLIEREDCGDGTWRGTFDAFIQPDSLDDKPLPDYRTAIVSGKTTGLKVQPERYVIRFREVAAGESLYLQYFAIDDAIYTNPELSQPEIVSYSDGQVEILGEKMGFSRKGSPTMGLSREGRVMFNAVRFFMAATGGDLATMQKLAVAPLTEQLSNGTAFALKLKDLSGSRDPLAIEAPVADENGYTVSLTIAGRGGLTHRISMYCRLMGPKVLITAVEPR